MFKKILFWVLIVVMVVGGVFIIYRGFNVPPDEPPHIEVITAPESQLPVGPIEAEVKVNEDNPADNMMNPESMKPSRLFIPSIGTYAYINTEGNMGSFKKGSMVLPKASQVTQWDEGSTVNSTEGVMLIAGHVSYNGDKGSLYDLHLVNVGEMAFVTDSEGNRQAFQMQSRDVIQKTDLPDYIFEQTGDKRLILVTCGGKVVKQSNGSYRYDSNVIVTFVPVQEDVSENE